MRSREADFRRDERIEEDRVAARNSLERYAYGLRDELGRRYKEYHPADTEEIVREVAAVVRWIDEAEDAHADTYHRRKEQLEKLRAAIEICGGEASKVRYGRSEVLPTRNKVVNTPLPTIPSARNSTSNIGSVKVSENRTVQGSQLQPDGAEHQFEDATQMSRSKSESQLSSKPVGSLWTPLRPRQFRLLHCEDKSELCLTLRTHDIEYQPHYSALSYACGSGSKSKLLKCSNAGGKLEELVPVSETLFDALTEVTAGGPPLWVDAICIDQTNQEEKAQQIAMMHQIYRRAAHVMIWLDRPLDEQTPMYVELVQFITLPLPTISHLEQLPALRSLLEVHDGNDPALKPLLFVDQLIRLASVISMSQRIRVDEVEFRRLGLPRFGLFLWRALGEIFSPPWLRRLWTFQELCLAQNATVVLGNKRLPWRSYYDAGMQLSHCGLLDHCTAHNAMEQQALARTGFSRLSPFLSSRQQVRPFWYYLDEARQREVTETVDRVYAVISLATEKLRTQIKVDYTKSSREKYWGLFIKTSKAMMRMNGSHAILARANSKSKAKQFPSWCPDFSAPCEVSPLSGHGLAGIKHQRSMAIHYDDNVINIEGIKIDKVDRPVPSNWANPALNDHDTFGPDGRAAHLLKWLYTCWEFTREAYAQEADAHRAYVLTMLGQILEFGTDHAESWFQGQDELLIGVRRRLETLKESAGPNDIDDTNESWHQFQDTIGKLNDIWRGRVFFITKNKKIGFASHRISHNDHVCIFYGEPCLYILRDGAVGYYQFVSDAYVDGYISGGDLNNLPPSTVFKIS